MKTYPKYKHTNIEWIGKIPYHWTFLNLGYESTMIVPMRDKPKELVGPIPWLRIEDFDGKFVSESKSLQGVDIKTVSEMNLKIFPIGTVLCSCSCDMGKTAIVKTPLITNQTFIGIVPKSSIDSNYLYYLMTTSEKHLNSISTGAIQTYLSREDFEHLKIPLPPYSEQEDIANFLDVKTTQIDELIEQKERLIELLQEKRTAVINQAVTKGINRDMKLKDTGIEWLSKIPDHWEFSKLKYIVACKITDGPHVTPDFISEGIPFISAEAIKENKIDISGMRGYISVEQAKLFNEKSLVMENDILFCKSGSTTGKSALVNFKPNFVIWSPLAIIRANKLKANHDYLSLYLQSNFFRKQVELYWSFGTQPNIGMNVIENLLFIKPPIDEQFEIYSYVKKELDKIDLAITKIENEIQLLHEYRKALISEAVTGKIDVRGEL